MTEHSQTPKKAHRRVESVRYEAHSGNAYGHQQKEVKHDQQAGSSPQSAKANPAGGGQRAITRLKPGEQGAKRWHSVTARGSKPELDYGYARNPCRKRPYLERTAKQRRWYETSGNSTFYSEG